MGTNTMHIILSLAYFPMNIHLSIPSGSIDFDHAIRDHLKLIVIMG